MLRLFDGWRLLTIVGSGKDEGVRSLSCPEDPLHAGSDYTEQKRQRPGLEVFMD